MVLTFNLEDSVVGEMKNRGSRISYLLEPYTVKTHLTVTPSLPLISKRRGAQLTRNWWKWGRGVWKYLIEKRALRQNEGLCLKMEGCHIILRSFLRFLMMQHRKKPWCVYLFFVNKYVLQNKCPAKKKMRWSPLIVST